MHINLSIVEDGEIKLIKPFEFASDEDAISTFMDAEGEFVSADPAETDRVLVDLIDDNDDLEATLVLHGGDLGSVRSLLYRRTLIGEPAPRRALS